MYLLTDGGALGVDPPPFRNVEVPEEPLGALAEYDVPVYEVRDGALLHPPRRYTWELASGQTGVDLNRNFRTLAWGYDGWGYPPGGQPVPGGSYNPSDLGYFGPAAGSEAETANAQVAFAHAAAAPGIAVTIDYHSRAQFILFPTEMSDYGMVSSNYAKLGVTLWSLVRSQAALDYQLGTPRDLFHADATGTVMDYAAQAHQSQAFTIELDPTLEVEDGWLLPEGKICGVFEKNIRGALAALAAPLNPGNPYAAEQIYAQILKKFLSWNVYDRGNQLPQ